MDKTNNVDRLSLTATLMSDCDVLAPKLKAERARQTRLQGSLSSHCLSAACADPLRTAKADFQSDARHTWTALFCCRWKPGSVYGSGSVESFAPETVDQAQEVSKYMLAALPSVRPAAPYEITSGHLETDEKELIDQFNSLLQRQMRLHGEMNTIIAKPLDWWPPTCDLMARPHLTSSDTTQDCKTVWN